MEEGMLIADYQPFERICATAGSVLYRARRLTDGMPVLLKLPQEPADAAERARLKREHLLLQSLHVAGAPKPLALIKERGSVALVLEDFAGESLEAMLAREPRRDLQICLLIGRHLADTLAGLDAAQVIHRDIRPANLLVVPTTGQILLVDFSVATARESSTSMPEDVAVPVGDWAYVSPEQTGRMNRAVDYRTDCYSMGVLLYRILTGELPFKARDPLEWTHCHIARMPRPAAEIVPELPQAVSGIVTKLLAKLPEDRYQSAYGLRADLDRCLAQWQASGRIDPFPPGTEDIPERFQVPHKLYGRNLEIERLLGAFESMVATGRGALANVSGYSGIGKSTLVDTLREPIVAKHGYFISGKFDQYQRDIPYATLTQAFRELVRQLLAESETHIAGWRQRIQAAVGGHGQLIVDVLPQVGIIIGPQPPVSALPPSEAQNRFRMVLRQFVTVFANQAHPLVLFLDDLQWIDAASLTLIEGLITHPDTRNLLLIGAYRDNEVDASHPLETTLETIRDSGAPVTDLKLAPLSVADLNRLVADTLHAPPDICEPLTRLVYERTEGNPFFFVQFLDALHEEGVLKRDAQHRAWQWDLDQIKAKDFADNVVDLMVGKLRQLPVPVQQALQLAACLGNTFELRQLALVSRVSVLETWQGVREEDRIDIEVEVEQALATAARASLIVRTEGTGKFLHDRIQQAAYSLIPETERAEVHLRIGRALLANLTVDELAEHVFDIANQFNRGAVQLVERDEKARVAALDLRAARRAKSSAAYASACVYLAAGMALLDDSDWANHYELLFSLWLERAECEFLTGRFDLAEQLSTELLRHCASKVDQAAIYQLKIQLDVVMSENARAVDNGLTCLRLFGIDLEAHPSQERVQAEYEAVWRNLAARPIESLIDLPLMSDPELLAAMRLLSALVDSAHFTDLHFFCLLLCRMMNISLQHGTSGDSAQACVFFGFSLGPVFHRYREGYRFARLGCDLVEKYHFVAYQAKVYFAMGLVATWTQPVSKANDTHRAIFRTAIESGAPAFACYSLLHFIRSLLLRGDPLDTVWREAEIALDFTRKTRFRDMADAILHNLRFIAAMQGQTASLSTFSGAQFDEVAFEAQLTGHRTSELICEYWVLKLRVRFLAGDYAGAFDAAQRAEPLLWSVVGQIPWQSYFFHTALTVAALFDTAPAAQQAAWRELLARHCEQLREWAETCAPTFTDKYALVSAEIARLEGRDLDAMRLYEEAIHAAHAHGFVQNEGIAHELASQFCTARGWTTTGRAHLDAARHCFARWGAHGKVRQLDARLAPLRELATSQPTASVGHVEQLDLLSVSKASQAISGQIVLDDLIDTLMRIVLESAGAQTCHLLLVRNEDLLHAAEAHVGQQTIDVQRHLNQALGTPEVSATDLHASEPVESALSGWALPASIINYVRRSQDAVLLADAMQSNPFAGDVYFARRQPKSVLCLPIMRRSTLTGLLYLENSLATHAFTPERVSVLELLASQAAISLENALLYADVQRENRERKLAEEELREREARIRRLVESNLIGLFFWNVTGMATDANDEFLRIVGYSRPELLSGQVGWAGMTPPEYRAADAHALDILRQGATCPPYEKEYIRKDGRRIPVLIGAALLEGSQENGVAFVLDLSERKTAEAELATRRIEAKRAREQLLALQAELAHATRVTTLGELSASIAHEVGQPLSAIVTSGEACLRWLGHRTPQPQEVQACVTHMIAEGRRASAIVQHIRSLTRGAAPQKTRLELNDVINDVVLLVQREVSNRRVSLSLRLASGLPALLGDRVQLQQVLINLLMNGMQAMAETDDDARELLIESRRESDGQVIVAVQDSGPGIDPANVDRLFSAFFTTKADGMGMGLSICRSIIEAHGGRLWASSHAGCGATFQFTLPSIGESPS
jgi:PAS domain S-box-containing protein